MDHITSLKELEQFRAATGKLIKLYRETTCSEPDGEFVDELFNDLSEFVDRCVADVGDEMLEIKIDMRGDDGRSRSLIFAMSSRELDEPDEDEEDIA